MNLIKAKPIRSATIVLWGNDRDEGRCLEKGANCEGSLISFDKRQIWDVFPYKKYSSDTEYHGACEWKGMYIRLGPKDFKRIFGEDIVERAEKGEE